MRGPVFAPGNRGYAAAKSVYNHRFNGLRPPAVVQVRDAADVQAVVRWADRFDVPLVARSGGHAYNGGSTGRTQVVVDLGQLDAVRLAGSVATIGPAAPLIEVAATLSRRGVDIPHGSCPTVALGGLVLGGGMGLAGRAWGLTLDRVLSFDVVTADGRRRRVDAEHQAGPLLGAARRRGELRHRHGRAPADAAGAAGRMVLGRRPGRRPRRAARGLGRPRADGARRPHLDLQPELRRRRRVRAVPRLGGWAAAAGRAAGPRAGREPEQRQRGLAGPAATLGGVPGRRAGDVPARHLDDVRGLLGLRPAAVERRGRAGVRRGGGRRRDAAADAYGGAIGEVAPAATAFVHRNVRFSVQILSYAPLATARAQVAAARRRIAPFGNGQAYQNYSDPDLADPLQAYYGANLPRLEKIKAAVDPAGRFRVAQGIR